MGLVHFEGGLQLFIQSDLMREGAGAGYFEIRGSEGYMEVREGQVRLMNASTGGWDDVDLGLPEGFKAIGSHTNAGQVRELLQVLEGGAEKHRNAGTTARDTVEVMMALYESARRNKVVHLPLAEKGYPLELMVEEGGLPVEIEGRYDIRDFLQRDGIDEQRYAQLRAEGLGHHQIMKQLHEEKDG